MQQGQFTIEENRNIARDVWFMRLKGDHAFAAPGQFAQISLPGFFLRRPISACDFWPGGFSVIYKVVGNGTERMAAMTAGQTLDMLTGLGNGFDLAACQRPLLIGGGTGTPPIYGLAKRLAESGRIPKIVLGFGSDEDVFLAQEFKELGCEISVATMAPGRHRQGLVTEFLPPESYDYFYACGPLPMLQAVCGTCPTSGQLSLEARIGCGFGVCMGCSFPTIHGSKRICAEGPVLQKEEIVWPTSR